MDMKHDASFTRINQKRKLHSADIKFNCSKCGVLSKLKNLQFHERQCFVHLCNHCGKTFCQGSALATNIKTVHAFERSFICDIYDKTLKYVQLS